ncbi:hypothetical protein WJ95_09575 [Burkholderia ubonensis]|uniref:hypothetical protein n=1 Tax=Burkholderia ubonensis TaxID=101571 RepID=UPI00075B4B80|nr:hypothetical protein [Burkholderia ubonensis]KVP90742.1 hypothetical protein WJ95_09575 [Burkholderia ubonensis]
MAEIDVKKLRELSNETREMARACDAGFTVEWKMKEAADAILALCDRLEAAEIRCDELLFDNAQLQGGATAEAIEAYGWRSRAEAAEKDAERYRWLRSQPNDIKAPRIDVVQWREMDESANSGDGLRMEELDQAVDTALAQRQGEGS